MLIITLPMENRNGHHSDMNHLTRRKEDMDWDEFDRDFNFDYKKKDEWIHKCVKIYGCSTRYTIKYVE